MNVFANFRNNSIIANMENQSKTLLGQIKPVIETISGRFCAKEEAVGVSPHQLLLRQS
ncbi:MAG: hypothetical protein BWY29_00963 [Microgenomates group bacterium ADurb.Bin238]|nr:MAG: hypothetical protein BWY29_00963 [Microgenomates group bacterium ADurb.Bin238]